MTLPLALIYTTLPSKQIAHSLAEQAIVEKRAACVNCIPVIESFYEWEGKLERTEEVVLLFKTVQDKVQELRDWLTTQHPYSVPAILQFNADANEAFVAYVTQQTHK